MSTPASRSDVTRLRLIRQGLAGPDLQGAPAVVGRMLALQAQDFPSAKWAIGLRSPGTSLADIDAAIDSGMVVRSWPMRGTLHFVPAVDLKWMLRLTSPRLVAGARTRLAQLEIDEAVVDQARGVAVDSLSGGRQLGRADFLQALETNGIATTGQRGYHLIGQLALSGTLCWGPQRGRQQAARAARRVGAILTPARPGRGARRIRAALFRRTRPGNAEGLRLVGPAHRRRREGGPGRCRRPADRAGGRRRQPLPAGRRRHGPARRGSPTARADATRCPPSTSTCSATPTGASRSTTAACCGSSPARTASSCRSSSRRGG